MNKHKPLKPLKDYPAPPITLNEYHKAQNLIAEEEAKLREDYSKKHPMSQAEFTAQYERLRRENLPRRIPPDRT